MSDNLPISEQFRIVAKQWCDAEAAASLLEDTKTAFLSSQIQKEGDIPHNRAEANVKASDYWREWITGMVEARKKANLLKVQLDYLRMRHSEQQSSEATRRKEMGL